MQQTTKTMRLTLTDRIVSGLTQDILAGRVAPGTPLDEGRLAAQFGASRTPIREAIRQLATSGLVQLRPHRAPLVALADPQRLADMFDVMAELEAMTAARAATSMSALERVRLERQHAEMGEFVRTGDTAAYRAANAVFHGMIYEGARNGYLRELALATRERLALHRGAQLEAPARLAQSYAEHGEALTAIMRGESQVAAGVMRRHLRLTQSALADLRGSADQADDDGGDQIKKQA